MISVKIWLPNKIKKAEFILKENLFFITRKITFHTANNKHQRFMT